MYYYYYYYYSEGQKIPHFIWNRINSTFITVATILPQEYSPPPYALHVSSLDMSKPKFCTHFSIPSMRTICHDHFILSDSLYYALHLPVISLFRPTYSTQNFFSISPSMFFPYVGWETKFDSHTKQEVKIQFCGFDLNVKCLRKPSNLRGIK
jgi:hypothetical protein